MPPATRTRHGKVLLVNLSLLHSGRDTMGHISLPTLRTGPALRPRGPGSPRTTRTLPAKP